MERDANAGEHVRVPPGQWPSLRWRVVGFRVAGSYAWHSMTEPASVGSVRHGDRNCPGHSVSGRMAITLPRGFTAAARLAASSTPASSPPVPSPLVSVP